MAAAEEKEQNQSSGSPAVAWCRCQAPCTLGAQSRSMSSSVMLARVASSTTAAACSTPRSGSPVAVAAATSRAAVSGSAMLPHSTSISAPEARIRAMVFCDLGTRLGATGEHDPPTTLRGHHRGKEQPEAAQAAGDEVGAVAAEDRGPLGRYHHRAVPGVWHVEDELAGVLGRAHHPDGGGAHRPVGNGWRPAAGSSPSATSRRPCAAAPVAVAGGCRTSGPGRRRRTSRLRRNGYRPSLVLP